MTKTFVVSESQLEKIANWHKRCKRKSGVETFTFIPTGIGLGLVYTCRCGKTLDVTEIDKW